MRCASSPVLARCTLWLGIMRRLCGTVLWAARIFHWYVLVVGGGACRCFARRAPFSPCMRECSHASVARLGNRTVRLGAARGVHAGACRCTRLAVCECAFFTTLYTAGRFDMARLVRRCVSVLRVAHDYWPCARVHAARIKGIDGLQGTTGLVAPQG